MVNEDTNNTPLVPTSAEAWAGKIVVEGTDVLLPSGNVARIKQISPQAFLSSGLIPDPLTTIIQKAINTKQGLPPKAVKELTDDPVKLNAAMELFDRVTVHVVIAPSLQMPPTCSTCGAYYNVDNRHKDATSDKYHRYEESPRTPGVLYIDQVQLDDKMYIFNWCLGSVRDLTDFREQLSSGVESVSNSQDVQRPAKRTARRT